MSDVGLAEGGFQLAGISDFDVLVEIQSICGSYRSVCEGIPIKRFYHVGDASFRARSKVTTHKACCSFLHFFKMIIKIFGVRVPTADEYSTSGLTRVLYAASLVCCGHE